MLSPFIVPTLASLQRLARPWTEGVRRRESTRQHPMSDEEFARVCDATTEAAGLLFHAIHCLSVAPDAVPEPGVSPSLAEIQALARPWTHLVLGRQSADHNDLPPDERLRLHDATQRAARSLFETIHALSDAPDVEPSRGPGMR